MFQQDAKIAQHALKYYLNNDTIQIVMFYAIAGDEIKKLLQQLLQKTVKIKISGYHYQFFYLGPPWIFPNENDDILDIYIGHSKINNKNEDSDIEWFDYSDITFGHLWESIVHNHDIFEFEEDGCKHDLFLRKTFRKFIRKHFLK